MDKAEIRAKVAETLTKIKENDDARLVLGAELAAVRATCTHPDLKTFYANAPGTAGREYRCPDCGYREIK